MNYCLGQKEIASLDDLETIQQSIKIFGVSRGKGALKWKKFKLYEDSNELRFCENNVTCTAQAVEKK